MYEEEIQDVKRNILSVNLAKRATIHDVRVWNEQLKRHRTSRGMYLCDWYVLSKSSNITLEDIVSTRNEPIFGMWNWDAVVENPNVTFDVVMKHHAILQEHHVYKDWFSTSPTITFELVLSTYKGYLKGRAFKPSFERKPIFKRWNWYSLSKSSRITFGHVLRTLREPKLRPLFTKWCWAGLSRNPNITLSIVLDTYNNPKLYSFKKEPLFKLWIWRNLSSNSSITFQDVMSTEDTPIFRRWNWNNLSSNPNVTLKDVLSTQGKPLFKRWKWDILSRHLSFEDVMSTVKIDAQTISTMNPGDTLSVDALLFKKWRWEYLSLNPNLTMEFVMQHIKFPWEWSWMSLNPMDRVPAAICIQRWWRRECPKERHKHKYQYVLSTIEMNPYIEHSEFKEKYLEEAELLGGIYCTE